MRIVACFHAPPCPPDLGPSRRHFHVLAALTRDHDVSVVSFGSEYERQLLAQQFGPAIRETRFVAPPGRWQKLGLRAWCGLSGRSDFGRLYRAEFQAALDSAATSFRPELLYLSTTMLGCYGLPPEIPVLGDTHNVEHDLLRRAASHAHSLPLRLYFSLQAARTRREEAAYTARCDTVCATSTRDAALLEALGARRVRVVPNGLDVWNHPFTRVGREPLTLVFVGLLSYYPNRHAIMWFLDRVFPRVQQRVPGVRLVVVGARPPRGLLRRVSSAIEVTGFVSDIRPYLARATAAIVPLHIGGGTRVKVLEAMAAGLPVVSTPLGCEGLDVRDEEAVLLAGTPEHFAAQAVRLLSDGLLRERLARRARAIVEASYNWTHIGRALDRACVETAGADRFARHA